MVSGVTDCWDKLPLFVPKCPMSAPWYVGLSISTAEGTPYQTEGMYLVYARVISPFYPLLLADTFCGKFYAFKNLLSVYESTFILVTCRQVFYSILSEKRRVCARYPFKVASHATPAWEVIFLTISFTTNQTGFLP